MNINTFSQNRENQLSEFIRLLNSKYSDYKIYKIQTKRFETNEYHIVLDSLVRLSDGLFNMNMVGKSFKNRDIKLISFGSGGTKILMWTQMHGDESTASLALLDVINFLSKEKSISHDLMNKISLYLIPILNPDGTTLFERRNNQEIDINRDALRLQTPEGRILKKVRDEIQPHFAFNLHDQYNNNSVGRTGRPASIAILAPPFDFDKKINDVRARAIQVCIEIKNIVEEFYPGVVARYDDEFEPRAFGDNFQKWGSSTILIESGGYFNDFEKQEIRKMNFLALLGSIYSIAYKLYEKNELEKYFEIPENDRRFFDLLVRNVIVKKDSSEYLVDLGISYSEKFDSLRNKYIQQATITDIGDLSTFFGFDTLDADGLKFEYGKVYEEIIMTYSHLKKLKPYELLKNGYTTIIYKGSFDKISDNSILSFMLSTTQYPMREPKKLLGHLAYFLLKDEQRKLKFAILNGKVFKVD